MANQPWTVQQFGTEGWLNERVVQWNPFCLDKKSSWNNAGQSSPRSNRRGGSCGGYCWSALSSPHIPSSISWRNGELAVRLANTSAGCDSTRR